jgi:cyanophycinase
MVSLVLAALLFSHTPTLPRGHLVIVGGGRTPVEVYQKALTLAGGDKAHVLVIPYASLRNRSGLKSCQLWQRAGAKQITVLDLKDRAAACKAIAEADLIWLGGGNQGRLMTCLSQHGLVDAIRQRFVRGATVGGTSAGAAVMSKIMLMAARGPNGLWAPTETAGLGLWPDVIVDQHFLRRHRLDRLKAAVLRHPNTPGVGIDEGTAVVVDGRRFEVLGRSTVMILAAKPPAQPGTAAAPEVVTQTLKPGTKFDLDKGVLSQP